MKTLKKYTTISILSLTMVGQLNAGIENVFIWAGVGSFFGSIAVDVYINDLKVQNKRMKKLLIDPMIAAHHKLEEDIADFQKDIPKIDNYMTKLLYKRDLGGMKSVADNLAKWIALFAKEQTFSEYKRCLDKQAIASNRSFNQNLANEWLNSENFDPINKFIHMNNKCLESAKTNNDLHQCMHTDHPPYPDVAIVCSFLFISQCAGTVRSGCK